MPLSTGAHLGPYEIIAPLGAGGMGEVYRARDTRLARDVAINVLPASVCGDGDWLQRFEQEARAAAALNAPNILAVHDVGTHDHTPYIVSELLEGDTLREKVRAGPLPARKAIDYAIQIAHGLAAAHEKGIVHRDLKPENVFVTEDGRVKILDFGLAKATERDVSGALSQVPTMQVDTLPGVVLGTIGYMAPEQVRGLRADHRSDIFSFGAILYALLSGQRAFRRDTTADTMMAILKEDPPDLPIAERHITPALARIVDRCLEKRPGGRFQSAGDLAFALDALSAPSGSGDAVPAAISGMGTRRWILVSLLSAAFVALAVIAGSAWLVRPSADARTMRFQVMPPEGWEFSRGGSGSTNPMIAPLAVSPDGRRIAFVARNQQANDHLWVRPLDELAAQELPGTDGASSPFWSPDSRSLGFFAGGKLKRIDISGGQPVTVCDTPDHRGGTWSDRGIIVFSPALKGGPLQKVAASGGVPVPVTTLEQGDGGHIRPAFLPDAIHFIYTATSGGTYIGSLESNARTLLFEKPVSSTVQYTQGHLLFMRETTLMAQPFDLRRLALAGEPFPVAEQVRVGGTPWVAIFSASNNGVLAYQTGPAAGTQLTWFDRTGKPLGTLAERASYGDLQMSPDGKTATVSVADSPQRTSDLWLVDVARGLRRRFTFDPADEQTSIWSPDSATVVFNSNRRGQFDLYRKPADLSTDEEPLLVDDALKVPLSWSRDGRFILYARSGPSGFELWVLPLARDGKPSPFLRNSFNNAPGAFSPDGRWVAYGSNESGTSQVYVTAFPGPGGRTLISTTQGGTLPRWRADGKEIFYRHVNGQVMAVPVSGQGPSFQVVGPVTTLFRGPITAFARNSYDVDATGHRFLVNALADQQKTGDKSFTVVVNWLE